MRTPRARCVKEISDLLWQRALGAVGLGQKVELHATSGAGMSLSEVVIAAAVLLVVSIGTLPLLIRSTFNNIHGLDSTQASQHAISGHESLLVLAVDDRRFELGDPLPEHTVRPTAAGPGDEMLLGDVYWDRGARAPSPVAVRLGDGDWIADPSAAQDLVFWRRRSVIRQYSYADISDGVIDAGNPDQLATLGDARLFDSPLASDAESSSAHFKEQEIQLESQRAGGANLGARSLRTRIVRTF